jgi:predicted dinucleotide-binding enzyme/predicted ester cyclase
MDIGIIGSGIMGTGLGSLWAKHGHHVMFSYSRRSEKLENLVLEIGSHARSGTPRDAVGFANVLFLAVPWGEVKDALSAAGVMNGKTIISCVTPFGPRGLEIGLNTSAAEEISKLVPGAAVVGAFNTIFASILHSRTHLFGSNMPTVFYCGNDRDAKSHAAELIRDAGLQPVDAGALENARYIEPLAMLMMVLGQSHRMGSDIALRLMSPVGATELVKGADVLARSFVGVFAEAPGSATGESVLAEDFVAYLPYSRDPIRGRRKYEDWMKQFRSGFSNFECDIDELIDDGMRAAVRWTWSGIHTGNLLGIAPTNRKIEFNETHLLRISGDRIAEDHVSANLLDLLGRLGTTQFAAA